MKRTCFIAFLLSFIYSTVFSQVGMLDLTFGEDGMIITQIGASDEHALSAGVMPDDSFILAGWSKTAGGDRQFAIVKYLPDGQPDGSFGNNGILTEDLSSGNDGINSTLILDDGSILVSGYNGENINDVVLAKYTSDGQVDPSFGDQGKVSFDNGFGSDRGFKAMVYQDNIYASARISNSDSLICLGVLKTSLNGTIDHTFGNNGIAFIGSGIDDVYTTSMNIQEDGKILVVGYSYKEDNGNGDEHDIMLAQFTQNGALDPSFASGGILVTGYPGNDDIPYSILIQPDDKIIIVGSAYSFPGDSDITLLRLNPDGSIDGSFGDDGWVKTGLVPQSEDYAEPSLLQPDGKIIVGGYMYDFGETNYDFFVARFLQDGSIDPSFGNNGWTKVSRGINSYEFGFTLAFQSNYDIILAGSTREIPGNYDIAAVRFIGDHSLGMNHLKSDAAEITISPNPASGHVSLQFITVSPDLITIDILDMQGRSVKKIFRQRLLQKGAHSEKIDIQNLKSGIYLLKVSGAGFQYSSRLIKY